MRLSEDEVHERLKIKGIKLLTPYQGSLAKAKFKCEKGHTWKTTPASVMHRTGCPHCVGNIPLSAKIINSRLEGRGVNLIGVYHGAHVSTLFECDHGHTWLARPNNVINGRNCPHCAKQYPLNKKTVNERIVDRGIEMIGDYINNSTPVLFKCGEGHDWEAMPANVMKSTGCPFCAGNLPLSKEIVNARITERGITMIGEYINNHTRARFLCEEGHKWNTSPASVLNGSGCPTCAENYSDNDVFYIWLANSQNKVKLESGEYLLKFGVSSERRGELRMRETSYAWGTKADILAIIKTKNSALNVEKRVKTIGKPVPNNLSNLEGFTEFRIVDKSQIAQFFSIAEEYTKYKILWRNPVKGIRPSGCRQLRLEF